MTSKYGNIHVSVDGYRFDSQKEAARYRELKLAERAGLITDLQLQVPFPVSINGQHICTYKADFVYVENGKRVVEDAKGAKTRLYLIKRKMVKAFYGIEILET